METLRPEEEGGKPPGGAGGGVPLRELVVVALGLAAGFGVFARSADLGAAITAAAALAGVLLLIVGRG